MVNVNLANATDDAMDLSGISTEGGRSYILLNDEPRIPENDLLGMTEIAAGVASVLETSIGSSPFTLAIDAGWGMGKSTLLHLIEDQLSVKPGIVKLYFNAWTSEGKDTLEGLIKSVLGKLDSNVLRRTARNLARQRNILIVSRLISGIIARFLGVPRLVDELWREIAVDAKARNEIRDWIKEMLKDWITSDGRRDSNRALIVFVDDLDRCSDKVVVDVCEAIKLYLSVPGLIFVIACDQSVLARGVSLPARGGSGEGRTYLEKIVQVTYRMPPPEEHQIKALIHACANESGTMELFDETVTSILAEAADRNPRRIKRIINSFVLEYRLDPSWRQPLLGSSQLVTAVLLQHLYTSFYDLLVNEESDSDPISEFLTYVDVRDGIFQTLADDNDPLWRLIQRFYKDHRLQPPGASEKPAAELERLEQQLPEGFPILAQKAAFVALLRRVQTAGSSQSLRAQLRRRPLATVSGADLISATTGGSLAGWQIVCLDDNPQSLSFLVQLMEDQGASTVVYSDPVAANQSIQRRQPDAIISDITRGDDPSAGFEHIGQLRELGYSGPVIFFTGRITPERRRRAKQLGALAIVTTERAVIDALLQ